MGEGATKEPAAAGRVPGAAGPREGTPPDAGAPAAATPPQFPGEVNGPKGPEPTRFGDWEKAGRCTDF